METNEEPILFPKLLKATEVAEHLNVSRALVYRLMQTEKIQSVKIGTARRVRPEDLKLFIEENLSLNYEDQAAQ